MRFEAVSAGVHQRDVMAGISSNGVSRHTFAVKGNQSPTRPSLESRPFPRKLNLVGRDQYFGDHRHPFNALIQALDALHTEKPATLFVPFLEKYFAWGSDIGEAQSLAPQPIRQPWIGVLHVPFGAPTWFEPSVSPETIFATELWNQSLPNCRGIVCLSEDLRRHVQARYPKLPTLAVKHPTELTACRSFDWELFQSDPTVVQVGDWLRQLQAIFRVQTPRLQKIMLCKPHTQTFLEREIEALGDHTNQTASRCEFMTEQAYDTLLSQSVVLCLLHGASANNAVLECLVRRTPIVISPLPSVIEYLGVDYPLYANSVKQASDHLNDLGRIRAAHEYLSLADALIEPLSYAQFLKSVASSKFYANLPAV